MRYSIFGFNQQKLIELQTEGIKLDMTDVLLMDYIQKALSQPSMLKTFEDGQPYVWLKHSKILEDLPILNIKENMLGKRLVKMIDLELIKSKVISNQSNRGSRTYYTITPLFESLQQAPEEMTSRNLLQVVNEKEPTSRNLLQVVERPAVINYRSNNQLENNDNRSISKDIEYTQPKSFDFGKPKQKKQSLYSKCMAHIQLFTNNIQLQGYLKDFLDSLVEMDKLHGEKQFVGILNKLNGLAGDTKSQSQIVQHSLEHGYATFYELKSNYNYSKPACASDVGKHSPQYTAAQKEYIRKARENGTAEKY